MNLIINNTRTQLGAWIMAVLFIAVLTFVTPILISSAVRGANFDFAKRLFQLYFGLAGLALAAVLVDFG